MVYNKWYKEVKEDSIPVYLKKGWGESRWRRADGYSSSSRENGYLFWKP